MEEPKKLTPVSDDKKTDQKKGIAEKLNSFLAENKISIESKIEFPQYRELPEEVQLAMKVIENHKGKIILMVVPEEGKSDTKDET